MSPYEYDEDFMDNSADDQSLIENWESLADDSVEPISNKLKNQKLVEEMDMQMTRDLFSGHTKPLDVKTQKKTVIKNIVISDPYESIKLQNLKDCELVAKRLSDKIIASQAKSPVWLQFIDILLQSCKSKMELKDLNTLKKKVEIIIKAKEDVKRELEYSKKKPNSTNFKNYKDELDMMYGDLSEKDEY